MRKDNAEIFRGYSRATLDILHSMLSVHLAQGGASTDELSAQVSETIERISSLKMDPAAITSIKPVGDRLFGNELLYRDDRIFRLINQLVIESEAFLKLYEAGFSKVLDGINAALDDLTAQARQAEQGGNLTGEKIDPFPWN